MTAAVGVGGPIWVGTSWKMTKTIPQARVYAAALREHDWPHSSDVQPFVIPPATALTAVRDELGRACPVLLGAQNAHWEDEGAWTGEVSMPQVRDAGARLVEIGHSERRQHFAETDRTVNLKVLAARRHGLTPLVCVGEPAEVFERGGSAEHVLAQVRSALAEVDDDGVLVAYEPIWAIGAGGRPAAPQEIAATVEVLAAELSGRGIPVLYGGSVSPENAAELLAVPHVDGVFVGRSAWSVQGFFEIVDIASHHSRQRASS